MGGSIMRQMAGRLHGMGIKQAWPCARVLYREERDAGDQWGSTIRTMNGLGIMKKCKAKGATGTMGKGWLGCYHQALSERTAYANVPKEILEQ